MSTILPIPRRDSVEDLKGHQQISIRLRIRQKVISFSSFVTFLSIGALWILSVTMNAFTTEVRLSSNDPGYRRIHETKDHFEYTVPAHRIHRELMEKQSDSIIDDGAILMNSRILVGIFSRDDATGAGQREYYRGMLRGDPRICSVSDFFTQRGRPGFLSNHCRIIYTFVVGGNPGGASEFISDVQLGQQNENQIIVPQIENPYSKDINFSDVTRLNIRENDNDGKSQTFLSYALQVVMKEKWGVEYYMKVGAETLFSLEGFFNFVNEELPPPPYTRRVIAGILRDKSYGMSSSGDGHFVRVRNREPPNDLLPRHESFWGNEFEGIHLYLSGQLYILSRDMLEFVVREVPMSKTRVAPGGYVIGREGHDISSMAFHSNTPLHAISISKSQKFWSFPIRSKAEWEKMAATPHTK